MPVGSATLLFLTLPGALPVRYPPCLFHRTGPGGRIDTPRGSPPGRLLRNLPDLVRLRLLGLVRVIRARVDLELAQRLTAKRVLRQHAPDGLLHRALRVLGHEVAVGHRAETARVAGL